MLLEIRDNEGILSTRIADFGLEDNIKNYLNRWLDITKSTMLFSKGIILVEGICEAMILPAVASIVLNKYNKTHKSHLPTSLEEAGVSVININGINFKYFYPLFSDLSDSNIKRLPIRCSSITDKDPKPKVIKENDGKNRYIEVYPLIGDDIESGNEAAKMTSVINKTTYGRSFVSPLKTFEYDLAINHNIAIMAETIAEGWTKGDFEHSGVKRECLEIQNKNDQYNDAQARRNDAEYIYKHIDCSELGKGVFSQLLLKRIENGQQINVPEYIQNAIIWSCGRSIDE